MKKFKKLIVALCLFVCMSGFTEYAETFYSETIPDLMEPYTVIRYIDESHYVIEIGGHFEGEIINFDFEEDPILLESIENGTA